jgi:phospholipid/cholesterol/gamma-HCH transport system substrate-binding protein
MFREEKLEFRVGIFIGIGLFLMFLIVFSMGDLFPFEKGYTFKVLFDYVNGLTKDAPVRLAGVDVGEVKNIDLYYDEEAKKTRVQLNIRVREGVQIEKDAEARINTLGLLGEQYLEISPGTVERFLKGDDILIGQNPMRVGRQMQELNRLVKSMTKIIEMIEKGEGTLGKLIMDDALYEDIKVIFDRLRKGEGTLGKLLADEKVYDDVEELVGDIKAHPWKLLHKPSDSKRKSD